ncbi:hypothetical protein BDK51DRAFT_43259 [Blyttiomyces helicus]|uniref:Uncharacterized protein n=1 Tax=Blyttiomyces helicus TaxID=388810 RepID=A0A4V1ISR7_9FUNG|nr:hypothetical protein BDK51DRAFT_43259 [Blyttiomyces helicus]|eukprot:RKO94497.1 hypothetical protein BDK51DRAFT_43259 [Blyttiomyces helicus]
MSDKTVSVPVDSVALDDDYVVDVLDDSGYSDGSVDERAAGLDGSAETAAGGVILLLKIVAARSIVVSISLVKSLVTVEPPVAVSADDLLGRGGGSRSLSIVLITNWLRTLPIPAALTTQGSFRYTTGHALLHGVVPVSHAPDLTSRKRGPKACDVPTVASSLRPSVALHDRRAVSEGHATVDRCPCKLQTLPLRPPHLRDLSSNSHLPKGPPRGAAAFREGFVSLIDVLVAFTVEDDVGSVVDSGDVEAVLGDDIGDGGDLQVDGGAAADDRSGEVRWWSSRCWIVGGGLQVVAALAGWLAGWIAGVGGGVASGGRVSGGGLSSRPGTSPAACDRNDLVHVTCPGTTDSREGVSAVDLLKGTLQGMGDRWSVADRPSGSVGSEGVLHGDRRGLPGGGAACGRLRLNL